MSCEHTKENERKTRIEFFKQKKNWSHLFCEHMFTIMCTNNIVHTFVNIDIFLKISWSIGKFGEQTKYYVTNKIFLLIQIKFLLISLNYFLASINLFYYFLLIRQNY